MKKLSTQEESKLLFECLFCCKKGKEKFVKQYWKLVLYTINRTRNKYGGMNLFEHTEDIRNETFIRLFDKDCRRLWKYKSPYEGGKASLAGWVMLLTSQTYIDYLRHLLSRNKDTRDDDPQEPNESHDWLNKTKQLIHDNLEELPAKDRRLLKLRYFFGYSSREIAMLSQEDFGPGLPKTPGAVDTAIMRVKEKLKQLIEKDLRC